MIPMTSREKCATCGHSAQWHKDNKPMHPFNEGQAGATAFLKQRGARTPRTDPNDAQRGAEGPPTVVWPNDPVLRVALLNKGILTADDLRAAEEQLRAVMGDTIMKGRPDGQ